MPPVQLDPVEHKIILLLQEDGRMATAEIARRIGVSEPTVRKKLAALQASGVLKIRASVEPAHLGYGAQAYIGVDVDRARVVAVAEALSAYPQIDSVAVTTGPYDLVVKAQFPAVHDLYEFIFGTLAGVEGIKDTHSFLVFQTFKHEGRILAEPLLPPSDAAPLPSEAPPSGAPPSED